MNCVDCDTALGWHSYCYYRIWCVGVPSLYIGCREVLEVLGRLVREQDIMVEWTLVVLCSVYGLRGL